MRAFVFVISLVSGMMFTQVPEFRQQYLQYLSGAVDELARIVRQFDEDCRLSGQDQTSCIRFTKISPDTKINLPALRMEENIARLDHLKYQQSLASPDSFLQFPSFVLNIDLTLAKRTFGNFRPGIPVTFNSAMFGLVGFAVSWVALMLVVAVFRRGFRLATGF